MPEVLILVFGYNHTLPDWEACMWGKPALGVYGRASLALRIAESYSSPLIFLGGGGVICDDGVSDASAARTLIINRAEELYGCSHESDLGHLDALDKQLHLDIIAHDTTQEVREAFALCEERAISKMILVSSPTHSARCLQSALVHKEVNGGCVTDVQAHPSDMNYQNTSAKDVVIIEPPHLHTSHKIPWNTLVKQMLPMVKGNKNSESFAKELEALLKKYENI